MCTQTQTHTRLGSEQQSSLDGVISVVTVIAADITTTVDSFHPITTATAVGIDVFDGRCSVGTPLTISTAAAASDMVNRM